MYGGRICTRTYVEGGTVSGEAKILGEFEFGILDVLGGKYDKFQRNAARLGFPEDWTLGAQLTRRRQGELKVIETT